MRRLPLLLSLALSLVVASPAAARDITVSSFDGTSIAASFFAAAGLEEGHRAATVLMTHGWGSGRDRNQESGDLEGFGVVGVGSLRRAGFNVLTWDSRGFGGSGGVAEVDSPAFEARDVRALVDWLAAQPEARLDAPGDPRVGMHGAGYGGTIGLTAAALDHRVDAIAPAISWHSLRTALYPADTAKAGWAGALAGLRIRLPTLVRLVLFPSLRSWRLNARLLPALTSAARTGALSVADAQWLAERGPGDLVRRIRAPTLLLQGTVDTLFPPSQAISNYTQLRRTGAPLKMVWFCGGHGVCSTGAGPEEKIRRTVIAWLKKHLARTKGVHTGPRFEWLADDGRWRASNRYPLLPRRPLVGRGRGRLAFTRADTFSGRLGAPRPATPAINVRIRRPRRSVNVVGQPRLTLRYRGHGDVRAGRVFAQIVDVRGRRVLGNQVTPVPLTLDGRSHTLKRRLEAVAARASRRSRYKLQLIGASGNYGPPRSSASVRFSRIRVALPAGVGCRRGPRIDRRLGRFRVCARG